MYPGTIIQFDDQSDITSIPITEVRNTPLFCAVFSSDKGTEAWTRISGSDFFNMYGNSISFSRHGQPLLQAAMSINSGAELICKRLVASDATLANIGIVATLSDTQVQSTDSDGNLLYLDTDGNETVEVTETAVMTDVKSVQYSLKSASDVKTLAEAHNAITEDLGDDQYLLYTLADNGRGSSSKRIKIIPNYTLSKSLEYTSYTLTVLEGTTELESFEFSIDPDKIVSEQNISLQSMIRAYSTQLVCTENVDGLDNFVAALADAAGLTSDEMYDYDPLFCCTNRGVSISGISLDSAGIDLQYSYGQILQNGDNGSFGDSPFISAVDEYTARAVEALDGTYDTTIFNVDQYKIDAFVDANYPDDVKRAIEALATFREDFMFFRDQGIGKTSVDLITSASAKETKSIFCSSYCQSYDIIDPYTKRQITVTIGYDLACILVNHFNNGRIFPTAGMKYSMTISNAIYGTLSFAPTICPDPEGNQKEALEDLRVNYASYIDNTLVVESLYTSQEKYSQWSFINNVMGIQEVVKAIRTRCPAIRYTFLDGDDLVQYKADVEEVIAKYTSNFSTLEMEYTSNATYAANKIFYATLKVQYKDFIQTEWFVITAISSES